MLSEPVVPLRAPVAAATLSAATRRPRGRQEDHAGADASGDRRGRRNIPLRGAKRLGFFAAEGLDVEVPGSQNGVVAAQVLQSKGAQVGTTAPEAIMLVREQGGDLVSFYGLKRNAGTFLVVLEDSSRSGSSRISRARTSAHRRLARVADWR